MTAQPGLSAETLAALERARELIEARCDEPISLGHLSRATGYSSFHLVRLFRRAYRLTPHQYLMQQRIQRAKQLLSDGELSVTDVCLAVGFQSPGSFSTLFSREVGYPPAVYRTRLQRLRSVPFCFQIVNGLA